MVHWKTLENVSISDFNVEGTEAPIFVRLGNRGRGYQDGQVIDHVGDIHGVTISRIMVRNAGKMGCSITGLPHHPVRDIWLSDITLHHKGGVKAEELSAIELTAADEKEKEYPEATMWGNLPAKGFFIRHARNVVFDRVRIMTDEPDARPDFVRIDAE